MIHICLTLTAFTKTMTRLFILSFALCCMNLAGCASSDLRAPEIDDNKAFSRCSKGLVDIYTVVAAQKENIPTKLKQRIVSLLIGAEIDSQFKSYPFCLDKLERARLFLKQANLTDIPPNQLNS